MGNLPLSNNDKVLVAVIMVLTFAITFTFTHIALVNNAH